MKKILLALDPIDIDKEAIEFATYISKLIRTRVTGAFLETNQVSLMSEPKEAAQHKDIKPASLLIQATSRFIDACVCRDTRYLLHKKSCVTKQELISESRFCDVLVLPPRLSSGLRVTVSPSLLVKQMLAHSDCPVILTPDVFEKIDEILFAFNGSSDAMFAIKQFTYLFPQFRNHKVVVLDVNYGKDVVAKKAPLVEWMESHYSHIEYIFPYGDPTDQLISYLLGRKNAFVVIGAYGRNTFSRLMKRSTAEPLSRILFNPIFIAHH